MSKTNIQTRSDEVRNASLTSSLRETSPRDSKKTSDSLGENAQNEIIIGSAYAKKLCSLIDDAKLTISVFMFDWRWYPKDFACDMSLINQAFVRASRRGLLIRVLTNYDNIIKTLQSFEIKAKRWQSTKLMHSKAVILDSKILLIGSHNFTENAMGLNIETSVLIHDPDLAVQLEKFFDSIWLS